MSFAHVLRVTCRAISSIYFLRILIICFAFILLLLEELSAPSSSSFFFYPPNPQTCSHFHFHSPDALSANLAETRSNVAALLSTPGSSNPCLFPFVPDFERDATLSYEVLICPSAITKAKICFYGKMFYSGATL